MSTIRSKSSERTIEFDGNKEPFYDYAALLALNPDRTKLVVLDGQHRLEALRLLLRTAENRAVVANIEQPICIVWMPNTEVDANDENIVKNLRSIFVTVNNEPLRVSGHFITLLNDDSYSAIAVRQLADNWKKETAQNWSRLHLLEWNTRDNQSTDQRLRPFSITTISIIDNALRPHLFDTSFCTKLLKLADRAEELQEAAPERDFGGLRDEATRDQKFDDIVKEQIDAHLVPALNIMLRAYRPYAELEQKLGQAFVELRRRREQGNLSADNLNTYLQRFVYRSDDFQDELTKAAWNEFRASIGPEEEDRVYFFAIYQHGLLRAWLSIARLIADIATNAVATAQATKAAFEVYVGNPDTRYLAPESSYGRRVLWRAGRVNFSSAWAHEAWTNIQLATLLRPDVRKAFIDAILASNSDAERRTALDAKLAALGSSSALHYTARLEAEIGKEVEKNLADYFGGEAEAGSMRDLRTTDRDDFDQRVSKKARKVFIEAIAQLAIHLMRDVDQLDPSG